MRIIYMLLLISLICLASAKYLPDENTSRALLRSKRSSSDTDNTIESQSNASDDDDDNDNDNDDEDSGEETDSGEQKKQEESEKLQLKYANKHRKLQAKREKEELKIEEELEKQQRKREKLEAKIREEERKLQEKLVKEERKREEKLAKEERKRKEKLVKEERKREEKLAKEELKRQEKKRKQLEQIENKVLASENKSVDSSESGEDLDFEDIWKNYICQKYGLSESSTELEKDAAVNRYLQEELGLNVNSTKKDYRQAVLQLVNNKLSGENSTSVNAFKNYIVSRVNAVNLQQLQVNIENKIAELENDTALLQNVSLPWAPEAKQAIGEEKSILTSIAQFLSDIVPTWITGVKPELNTSISSPPSLGISSSGISDTSLSNAAVVPSSNTGSVSTSEFNNVGPVNGTVAVTEAAGSSDLSIVGISDVPTSVLIDNESSTNADGTSNVVNQSTSETGSTGNSNIDALTSSSNVDLNENSLTEQSTGSVVDNNGSAATVDTSASGSTVSEGFITNDTAPLNSPAGNSPSGQVVSDADVVSNVNANTDALTSTSNVDLNENTLVDQTTGSIVDSNGSLVTVATTVSSSIISDGFITNDTSPSNSPAGNSPSTQVAIDADGISNANANIDAVTNTSNMDLNGNTAIDQSLGSMVFNNGSAATVATSVAGATISEGFITNDILPSNSPAVNSPSDQIVSDTDGVSNVNANADAITSTSNVNLNENTLIGQPDGFAIDDNSSATIPTSVVDSTVSEGSVTNTNNKPSVPAFADAQGADVKPVEITNIVEETDSQIIESNIAISASPSAESSISTDNLSTGTEASSSSVTSGADEQISTDNVSIASSGIQTGVESGIENNPSNSEVSVNTAAASTDVEITPSIDITGTVTPSLLVDSSDDTSNTGETTETVASNSNYSITSTIDSTSTGGQIADPSISSSTSSSANVIENATSNSVNVSTISTEEIASVGTEVTVENSGTTVNINNPLNITTDATLVTSTVEATGLPSESPNGIVQNNVDKPVDITLNIQEDTAESSNVTSISSGSTTTDTIDISNLLNETKENTVNVLPESSDLSVNIGNTVVSSSTNESVINTSDAASTSTVENPAPVSTSVSQENTGDVSVSVTEVTHAYEAQSSADNVLPASSLPSENTDNTVEVAGTDGSNTANVVTATTEITAAPVVVATLTPQPVVLVPVPVTQVTDISETQSSDTAISVTGLTGTLTNTNETTEVSDTTVNKDVSVNQPEEVTNMFEPITTQTSIPENEVPVAITVISEPPVDVVLDVAGELTLHSVNMTSSGGESTTISVTTDSLQTVSVNVDTPAAPAAVTESTIVTPAVISDSVVTFITTSAGDTSASSNDVTLVPVSETIETDSGLLGTSEVIITTEVPQVAQNTTTTPIVPQEIGASLLEVTVQ